MKVEIVCFFLFILVGATSSQNLKCPFEYVFHFGDGVTDVGNSILIENSIPASRWPYGSSFPGWPNGRWSDGLIDFDFSAADFGFPELTPYLSKNISSSKGIIFSVARSPVLDRSFFTRRGIKVPPYVVSLKTQFKWFKTYLRSICSTRQECADIVANSLVILGDIEGNDVGYALSQGRSIEELKTFVPLVTQTQIDVARELIRMGATRVGIPGNSPIGCYPYILTARRTNDPSAYDNLGCLKDVNDLIAYKNNHLREAVDNLQKEFPDAGLFYSEFGNGVLQALNETFSGPHKRITLKACCGIGGKYNYDERRFCGSPGVPVCPNPDDYIFWDGLHFTQEASSRIEQILVPPGLGMLNCTTPLLSASM